MYTNLEVGGLAKGKVCRCIKKLEVGVLRKGERKGDYVGVYRA